MRFLKIQNLCVKSEQTDEADISRYRMLYANDFTHKNISRSSSAALLHEMFMHYISNETKLHFLLFFYQQLNPERYKAGENERAG